MITKIASYHLNPFTCGVARFNHSLSKSLGIPLVQLGTIFTAGRNESVLISIKLEELDSESLGELADFVANSSNQFSVLLHGFTGTEIETKLCLGATTVFAASREIANEVQKCRSDVVAVFAPGAPVRPIQENSDCEMLTIGMAHKIRSIGYQRLAQLMQSDARTFRLDISTALHEGGAFDEHFFQVGEEISIAFDGKVRFLGFLADDEVSERLRRVDALVAFFPRGVRENNTTVLSAMSHGCPVITNLDDWSPDWMIHEQTIFDINQLQEFPSKALLRQIGKSGAIAVSEFNFQRLSEIIKRVEGAARRS